MDEFYMAVAGDNRYKLRDSGDLGYYEDCEILEVDNIERVRELTLSSYKASGRAKEFIFVENLNGSEYYYNMFPKDFYSLVLDNTIVNGKISINSKVVKRGQRCGLKQVK